jgi:STE24 endopeptidase
MRRAVLIALSLVLAAAPAAAQDVAVPAAASGVVEAFRLHEVIWGLAQLAAVVLPFLLVVTRAGAALARFCTRIALGRRTVALVLFAALYLLLAALVAAPFDYWRQAPPALGPWLVGEIVPLLVRIVVAALFLWIPYGLMRRSPRLWWLWSALALVPVAFLVLVALPVVVDPLTAHYEPLADKALAQRIASLAERCGVRDIPVFIGGDDDTAVGLGPTRRIFLQADIQKAETPAQIEFTVAHELKHYVLGDNWTGLAIISGLMLAGLFLVHLIGRRVAARGRFGITALDDPASLPLVVLVFTLLWLCVLPAFNWEARRIEFEADRFGLELSHQNRAAAEMFASWVKTDEVPPEFDLFFRLFRQTHPSLGERIRFANGYKPWETGAPLVYGDVCR